MARQDALVERAKMRLLWASVALLVGLGILSGVASVLGDMSTLISAMEGSTEIDKAFWALSPYIVTGFLFVAVVYILLGKGKGTARGGGD